MPECSVVLLAGPSGSGKSRLTRVTDATQLRLDDFYHEHDHPGLPRRDDGLIDWDDPATWDAEAALRALQELLAQGRTTVPVYSIAESRRTGTHTVGIGARPVVVAEGIFAIELLRHCRAAGLLVTPIWLDRPRPFNFGRRLRRDLQQKRKPPLVLLRRGARLFRDEPGLRSRAVAAGFRPLSMTRATALVNGLAEAGLRQAPEA